MLPRYTKPFLREFADGGLDLLDFQQDYLMGKGVKVTFFAPEPYALTVLEAAAEAPTSGPRLASLPELFRSKALLSARRSRSRDYFDLHVLMVRCGFTMSDYHSAFERAGIPEQAPIGLSRLCAPTAVAADPGYDTLAPDAPSREELVRFFVEQRDRFERSEAARAFRDRLRQKGTGGANSVCSKCQQYRYDPMVFARLRAEWQVLRRQRGLTGSVLVGGSALALRLGHRLRGSGAGSGYLQHQRQEPWMGKLWQRRISRFVALS
jgi:hypothetical protein